MARRCTRTTAQYAAALVAAVLIFLCITPSALAFRRLELGDTLGDFTGETLNGEPIQLSEHMGEKATIFIFWAAWSPRSSVALADYQELWKAHRDKGLSVFALNVEHHQWDPNDLPLIQSALEAAKVTYPVAADKSLDFYYYYGISAVPSTVLTDSQGKVVYLLPGYPTMLRDEFRENVERLLGIYEEEVVVVDDRYKPKGKAARYFNMAKLFHKKKMYSRAVKNLEIALTEDPDYAEAAALLEALRAELAEE